MRLCTWSCMSTHGEGNNTTLQLCLLSEINCFSIWHMRTTGHWNHLCNNLWVNKWGGIYWHLSDLCQKLWSENNYEGVVFEDIQVPFFIWNNKAIVKGEDLEIYSTCITVWHHPILDEYVISSTHGQLSSAVFHSSKPGSRLTLHIVLWELPAVSS